MVVEVFIRPEIAALGLVSRIVTISTKCLEGTRACNMEGLNVRRTQSLIVACSMGLEIRKGANDQHD